MLPATRSAHRKILGVTINGMKSYSKLIIIISKNLKEDLKDKYEKRSKISI
jgi:hypothetical protein